MDRVRIGLPLLLCGAVRAGAALAQPAPALDGRPPPWKVSVTPYAWTPALTGSLGTPLPRVGDRSFSLGSGSVLTDLDAMPLMVAGEARYGRLVLMGDVLHAGLRQGLDTPHDLLWQGGHARVVATGVTLLGGCRVVDAPGQTLDLGAGTRIWNVDAKLSLNPGLAARVIQKPSANWADPLVAARYHARLLPRFGVTPHGDIGGFDAASRLTWQAVGSPEYSPGEKAGLHAGWRYLSVERTRGATGLDLGFNGPFVAASFRF